MKNIQCPGADRMMGTPEITVRKCPDCGSEIELFRTEEQAKCPDCGAIVQNEVNRGAIFKG